MSAYLRNRPFPEDEKIMAEVYLKMGSHLTDEMTRTVFILSPDDSDLTRMKFLFTHQTDKAFHRAYCGYCQMDAEAIHAGDMKN